MIYRRLRGRQAAQWRPGFEEKSQREAGKNGMVGIKGIARGRRVIERARALISGFLPRLLSLSNMRNVYRRYWGNSLGAVFMHWHKRGRFLKLSTEGLTVSELVACGVDIDIAGIRLTQGITKYVQQL